MEARLAAIEDQLGALTKRLSEQMSKPAAGAGAKAKAAGKAKTAGKAKAAGRRPAGKSKAKKH